MDMSTDVAAVPMQRICCICRITEGAKGQERTHGYCLTCEEVAIIEDPSVADLMRYAVAVAVAPMEEVEYAGRRYAYLVDVYATGPRSIINASQGRTMKKNTEGAPAQEWNRRKFPRLITVDDALWAATHKAAKATGSNASATVRAALRAYGPVRDLLPEEMREEGADDE